ncbi:MAG: hypothetical protein ACYTGC_12390 [Planctomycetota bacterium]
MTRTAILLSLAVTLVASGTALGQGTSRRFSDPLTFDQMRELLAPLRLSEHQQAAADAAHERCLRALLELRHGRTSKFLSRYGTTPIAFLDEREQLVEATRERRAILAEIERIEEAMFAEIAPVLTDEQGARLPRLAARRERQRLRDRSTTSMATWSMPRLSRLDLTSYIDDLELDDAVRERIDASVAAYETALTPLFRAIFGLHQEIPLAYFDRTYESRRARDERLEQLKADYDMQTEEGREQYARAVAEVMENEEPLLPFLVELTELEEIRGKLVRVSRLNRQLLDDLRARIDEQQADELERRYVRRALGTVRVPRDPLRRRVGRFVGGDAEPEVVAAVEDLYRQFTAQRRRLVRRLVTAAEKEGFRREAIIAGEDDTQSSDLERARDAVRNLDRSTLEKFAALTGEPIEAPRQRHTAHDDGHPMPLDGETVTYELHAEGGDLELVGDLAVGQMIAVQIVAEPTDGDAPAVAPVGAMATIVIDAVNADDGHLVFEGTGWNRSLRSSGWLPGAYRKESFDELAEALRLDDALLSVVASLYDDYRTAFAGLEEQVIGPARAAVANPGHGGDAEGDAEAGDAYAGVRVAMDAILALDGTFFDDVRTIGGAAAAPAIERAERMRLREAYAHVGRAAMFQIDNRVSREHETDLLAVAMAADAGLEPTLEPVAAYDRASVSLFAQRWHSRLDAATDVAWSMASSGEGVAVEVSAKMHSPAARRAEQQLRGLNRATLADLEASLEPARFLVVRDAYLEKAFGAVLRDPGRLDDLLTRAGELPLAPQVRPRFEELCLSYRSEYATLCDRMVEKARAFDDREPNAGEDRYEHLQRFHESLGADEFERKNLNQRTRQALIELLDDDGT